MRPEVSAITAADCFDAVRRVAETGSEIHDAVRGRLGDAIGDMPELVPVVQPQSIGSTGVAQVERVMIGIDQIREAVGPARLRPYSLTGMEVQHKDTHIMEIDVS